MSNPELGPREDNEKPYDGSERAVLKHHEEKFRSLSEEELREVLEYLEEETKSRKERLKEDPLGDRPSSKMMIEIDEKIIRLAEAELEKRKQSK